MQPSPNAKDDEIRSGRFTITEQLYLNVAVTGNVENVPHRLPDLDAIRTKFVRIAQDANLGAASKIFHQQGQQGVDDLLKTTLIHTMYSDLFQEFSLSDVLLLKAGNLLRGKKDSVFSICGSQELIAKAQAHLYNVYVANEPNAPHKSLSQEQIFGITVLYLKLTANEFAHIPNPGMSMTKVQVDEVLNFIRLNDPLRLLVGPEEERFTTFMRRGYDAVMSGYYRDTTGQRRRKPKVTVDKNSLEEDLLHDDIL